jgi:hypothetical protein
MMLWGAEVLQVANRLADKVRKPIHWLAHLQESVRALLINSLHPRSDRGWCNLESIGRLLQSPTASRSQFQDR